IAVTRDTLMGWSEFLYLGVGLGLGWGANRWGLGRRNGAKSIGKTDRGGESSRIRPAETEFPHLSEMIHPQIETLSEQLQQVRLAYHMAAEMEQFKAGFLARTSHELRSPLNSMIGLLQLILADLCESPEEEREFIQQAHDATLRMVGLLDEVVHVAKTEYGTERMNPQPVQLAPIFEEIHQLTHLQAANRSIRLSISAPDPTLHAIADRPRLKQVLLSLVDAAIAGMDEGKVRMSAHPSPESGYVHIWIDDQRPVGAWSESWDLLQSTLEAKDPQLLDPENLTLSPGMRLLINQTLLALMNGRLEVLAVPSDAELSDFTRTQCSVPLATKF
ncbi:MAG: sensor histidine kinase, partial [Limnospira sp.]